MHITKVNDGYDAYKAELSWSELQAIETALAAHHTGVIADETYARLKFYMGKLPRPGEAKGSDTTLEQTKAKEALDRASEKPIEQLTPEDIPMPPDYTPEEPGHEPKE